MNNATSFLEFSQAIGILVNNRVIKLEHAEGIAKKFLKDHGFDTPKPLKPETVIKE